MTKNTRAWIRGLLSALFSGAAGVLAPMAVDPGDFNFAEPTKLLIVAAWSAGIGVVNYLARSPLPDDDDDNRITPRLPLVLLAISLGTLAACAPPTVQTPEGKRAHTANEVLKRVEHLQTAAIHAHKAGALNDAATVTVLRWAHDAADVLEEAPESWFPIVRDSYLVARKHLADQLAVLPPMLQEALRYLDLIFQPERGVA